VSDLGVSIPADGVAAARVGPARWARRRQGGRDGRRANGQPKRAVVLLRRVPGDTAVHRLWAGTKLVAVAVLGVVLSLAPSWPAIAVTAALVAGAFVAARIPAGAVVRPPRWFWVVMALGGVLTLASGGHPVVGVGGVHLGLGRAVLYVRFVCLTVVLVAASAMVSWTTELGEIAPALARLFSPLRRLRVPVDEWAVTVALCVRSLPLLMEEMRIRVAARRLRARPTTRRTVDDLFDELIDLISAALAASLRRAVELGEAITARGGTGQLTAYPASPGRSDAVALLLVALTCVASLGLPQL